MNKISWSAVRPIVTLAFVSALIYGFIADKITSATFVPIAASCVTWWYTTRDATKTPTEPTK